MFRGSRIPVTLLLSLLAVARTRTVAASAFFNEIHYDNDGADVGEFVELAYTDDVADITAYKVLLYNGNDGATYNTISVPAGTLVADPIRLSVIDISGIQNGSPDGIALVDASNAVVEFLSYEGVMVATSGPASGMSSTDMGVSETSSTPSGFSLQRSGSGCAASDFTWMAPQTSTKGMVNAGQTFTSSSCNNAGGNSSSMTTGFGDQIRSSSSARGNLTSTVNIPTGSAVSVGTLPSGYRDIFVHLDCPTMDGNIELYDGTTQLVGTSGSQLNGVSWGSTSWNSLRLEYSGSGGELRPGTFGQEYLFVYGTLPSDLELRVSSVGVGGTCTLKVNWGYYETAWSANGGNELKNALHEIIDDHEELSYTPGCWEALKRVDQDKNNPENVIGIYTRRSIPKSDQDDGSGNADAWNREHVWAKSQGSFGTSPGAGTDIHALRVADRSVNTARSNQDFANGGDPVTDCSQCKETSNTFEPPDEVKGAVARMIFYMATRYNGDDGSNGVELIVGPGFYESSSSSTGEMGDLKTLLAWNKYPPSDDEYNRNNLIFLIQGNRNPYIDNPRAVDTIWDPNTQSTSFGFASNSKKAVSVLSAIAILWLL